jgi:putative hydrolase of the HAD superfamily
MALGGVTVPTAVGVPTASALGSTSSIPVESRLVTLDALGTLVYLDDPYGRLAAELSIPHARAREALRAEMAYYRQHHDIASDRAGLERLRDACTEVLRDALGGSGLDPAALRAALLRALRFRAYPEVPGVLRGLRAAGIALVVVSNWDVSLHDVMEQTGLRGLVDGVLTSAEAGEPKPGGAMFRAALDLAGARPAEALHVGDSVEHDVAGALAMGMRAVLVDRDGEAGAVPAGVAVVRDLRGADPGALYPSR